MNIALVLGRGIEGAGVTRYVIELCNYFSKHSIKHTLYVVDDKKWPRAKAQVMPEYVTINKNNINIIYKDLNKHTHVILNSVPSTKHSQEIQDGFLEMYKKIENPFRIIMQIDHKLQSISRNANYYELCKLSDGILSHSNTSPFFKKLKTLQGNNVQYKFLKIHLSYDFSKLAKYRQNDHLKKITYLGRHAGFKHPDRLFGFVPYAKKNQLHLEMRGIERSIGALYMFYDGDPKLKNARKDVAEVSKKNLMNGLLTDHKDRDYSKVYIYGPYNHDEGMKALSSSMIGADFYHLDPEAYGDNFEYAQCEIIGVGTIPMFDYTWAENVHIYNKGVKTDQTFLDLDTYGFFVKKDLSNVEEVVDRINEVWNSPQLKKQYLETSFEVTRDHCDVEYNLNRFVEDLTTLEKRRVEKKETKALF